MNTARNLLLALPALFAASLAGGLCLLVASGTAAAAPVQKPALEIAQLAPTLPEQIAQLERQYGLPIDPSLAIGIRLNQLELRVLGMVQQGSVIERLRRLQTPPPSQEPGTAGAPGPVYGQAPVQAAGKHTGELGDALPLVNVVPANFLRIEPPGAHVDPQADYYPAVLRSSKGKVLRFKSMPITVYINPYPDRAFVIAVIKGFEAWEDRSGGVVRFVQTDSPQGARILVDWKHLGAAVDRSGCLLGAHTITKYKSHGGHVSVIGVGVVPVPIYIPRLGPKYEVPPQVIEVNLDLILSKEKRVRYPLLQNVVTHELGHALGLLGHSANSYDMMNPVTDEHSRLSVRDINTLIKLYQKKVDVPL